MMRMKKILDGLHGNELEAVSVPALLVLEAERAHFREMRPKILKMYSRLSNKRDGWNKRDGRYIS